MARSWIGTSWKMNTVRAEARAYAETLRASPLVGSAAAQLFVIPPFRISPMSPSVSPTLA